MALIIKDDKKKEDDLIELRRIDEEQVNVYINDKYVASFRSDGSVVIFLDNKLQFKGDWKEK